MDKIIINGMGVLGRELFRQLYVKYPDRIAAINDPNAAGDNLAYLLNYESAGNGFLQPAMLGLGGAEATYTNDGKNDYINVGGKSYILLHETTNNYVYDYVDKGIVIDCTGATTKITEAQDYLTNGATHAIICNWINDPSTPLIVYGVNDSIISTNSPQVISTGTSDLQAIAVVLKAIEDHAIEDQFEINSGSIRTITAYAASQQITDGYSSRYFERGRSAAANIVPTATSTKKLIGAVIPQLHGRFLGDEFRVPILQGGVFNLTLNLNSSTSREAIVGYIKNAKQDGILSYTTYPIVSSDVVNSRTLVTIPDGQITVNGSLVNITGLYDNVVGFAAQIIRIAEAASESL